MLSTVEIEQALSAGYELRGFEVKGPGSRDDAHYFAKVVRAVLSMANLRDGGHVLLGVTDTDLASLGPGLDESQADGWASYDDVARKLGEYADPPVRFDIKRDVLTSGAAVVVIEVHEFADVPILCSKDYPNVLRKGACYVRPRRVPESSEVASSTEMRDLLQIATEKALRAFLETASRAGAKLEGPGPPPSERFEAQRKDAW